MDSDLWGAFIRVIVSLPIIAVLAYLFIKFGLAKNRHRSRGNLEIVEQVALLPKATLNIVRVNDKFLLFGATEQEIHFIKELDDYTALEPLEFQFHLTDAIKKLSKGSNRHDP